MSSKKKTSHWPELPSDVMVNVLLRIGVIDILKNVQKVCTAWREICKDPSLWRVVNIDRFSNPSEGYVLRKILIHAMNKSQGQLVDLTMAGFYIHGIFWYAADRLSQLRRLQIVWYFAEVYGNWSFFLVITPLLEELCLVRLKISQQTIESIGRYCPLLKALKVKHDAYSLWHGINNEIALAIGKKLPELTHLELIGNPMNNIGLQAILDGCCHLELLDLRLCFYLDLTEDLGKRCSQQIKHLKLPNDHLHWCP